MFQKLSTFYRNVKANYDEQDIPKISGSLVLSSLCLSILGKTSERSKSHSFVHNFTLGIHKFIDTITEKQLIPTIPSTEIKKPVCIFDMDDLLITKKFSFLNLKSMIYKRPFTQTFLFHMAHFYELILLTQHDIHEGQKILNSIDPYGCIAYRVFLKDKRLFTMKNINRSTKQLINIKTEDEKLIFNDHLIDNTIVIPKWKGSKDSRLLDLLSFCTNLAILGVPDYRNTLMSYKNTSFFDTFDFVQKMIFKERNMFTWNYDKAYKSKVDEINKERIETFEKARLEMEQQLERDRLYKKKYDVFTKIHNIVLNLIF